MSRGYDYDEKLGEGWRVISWTHGCMYVNTWRDATQEERERGCVYELEYGIGR